MYTESKVLKYFKQYNKKNFLYQQKQAGKNKMKKK